MSHSNHRIFADDSEPESQTDFGIHRAPAPEWRLRHKADTRSQSPGLPVAFLLEDCQYHLATGQRFHGLVLRVQSGLAEWKIPFDPESETVALHQVRVWRNKKATDATPREPFLAEATPDGGAVVRLPLKAKNGDAVDLSYTLVPHEIPHGSDLVVTQPLQWAEPRQDFHFSVHVPAQRKVRARFHGQQIAPAITRAEDGSHILSWQLTETEPLAAGLLPDARSLTVTEVTGTTTPPSDFRTIQPGGSADGQTQNYRRRRRSSESGYPHERSGKNTRLNLIVSVLIAAVALAAIAIMNRAGEPEPPAPESPPPPKPPAPASELPSTVENDRDFRQAERLVAEKQYADAIRLLLPLLERNPTEMRIVAALATAYFQSGDFAACLPLCDDLLAKEPESPLFHTMRGDSLFNLRRMSEAADSYEQAIDRGADESDIWLSLARCDEARENFPTAIARYREGLKRHPAEFALCNALADLLVRQDMENEAIAELEKFAEANPNSARAWRTLSMALLRKREINNAVWAAEKAEDLSPDSPSATRALAEALFQAEKFDEALIAYERVSQMLPESAPDWVSLGLCCLRLRLYDDAITALERAVAIDPNRPQALNNLAAAFMNKGDDVSAGARLRECVAIAPDYKLAWENLLEVSRRTGDDAGRLRAEAELARIREKTPAATAAASGP